MKIKSELKHLCPPPEGDMEPWPTGVLNILLSDGLGGGKEAIN